jgi:hypothetical protein
MSAQNPLRSASPAKSTIATCERLAGDGGPPYFCQYLPCDDRDERTRCLMSWIFAFLGLAATIGGGGAIVMGWPLVPLERGWTMVIAGAVLSSGGLVCLALAALMVETRRTRLALERGMAKLAAGPGGIGAAAIASTTPQPLRLDAAAPASTAAWPASAGDAAPGPSLHKLEPMNVAVAPAGEASDAAPGAVHAGIALASGHEPVSDEEMQPARSFTVGDTTFVVFSDGSIEARTADGTKRFESMDEVRAYLETAVA